MVPKRQSSLLMVAAILACAPLQLPPLAASSLDVVHDQAKINQATAAHQSHATVSLGPDGISLVVWQGTSGRDVDRTAVLGRWFDKSGQPVTGEFLIDTATAGDQTSPDVDSNPEGLFAVAWSAGRRESGYHVYVKLLASPAGDVVLPETQVSQTASKTRMWPDVAVYDNGDVLIVWDRVSEGRVDIFSRLFNISGTSLAGPTRINDISSDAPPSDARAPYGVPDVDVNGTGGVVAVWERVAGSAFAAVGRSFDPYSGAHTAVFLIDSPTAGMAQRRPMVDANEEGDAIVTWRERPEDSHLGDIVAKRYDATLGQWGERIIVHDRLKGIQHRSVAKLVDDGRFVVAWTSVEAGEDNDIYMRFFDPDGIPISKVLRVNSPRAGEQLRPAVAIRQYVDHVLMAVTWEAVEPGSDGLDVFGKLYRIEPDQ